jgi:hypothetical protein
MHAMENGKAACKLASQNAFEIGFSMQKRRGEMIANS